MISRKLTCLLLKQVEDYQGFEAFCNDLMVRQGFETIEPLGGQKDKGRDALHICRSSSSVTIFAYSVEKRWEAKLGRDLKKIQKHAHKCDEVVFVTNGEISTTQRDTWKEKVKSKYAWDLELYSLDRIAVIVDNHPELIDLHPSIFPISQFINAEPSESLDIEAYNSHVVQKFEEWHKRYTPIFAEQRELEIFVERKDQPGIHHQQIPVLQLPETSTAIVLLGESGSGKTTALWKMALEVSKQVADDNNIQAPIIIRLRDWSSDNQIRSLVQNEFSVVDASDQAVERLLTLGQCLLLIDGVNELPGTADARDDARRDLQNFVSRYPRNKLVLTCRTPDYDYDFIEIEEGQQLPVYEIQRLEQAQIEEYIRRYFNTSPEHATDLLYKLQIRDSRLFYDEKSFLQLIRIPIYLQLAILYYEQHGQIPDNKAVLLQGFVGELVRRERGRVKLTEKGLSEILGLLVYVGLKENYYLVWPMILAKEMTAKIIQRLQTESVLPANLSLEDVWQQLISQNFLSPTSMSYGGEQIEVVEWLHQLLFDYFLARAIVGIVAGFKRSEINSLKRTLARSESVMEQPLLIAAEFLDAKLKSRLLEVLLSSVSFFSDFRVATTDLYSALNAVTSSSTIDLLLERTLQKRNTLQITFLRNFCQLMRKTGTDKEEQLLSHELEKTLNKKTWDGTCLEELLFAFPYDYLFNQIGGFFRVGSKNDREHIAETFSNVVVRQPVLENKQRVIQILQNWTANSSELVRFYAAKALYADDPAKTAVTLKQLYINGRPKVRRLVEELKDDWGLE